MLETSWKKFVREGVLDPTRLSKRIMESWYRSKQYDVNPYLEKAVHILDESELKNRRAHYKPILDLAAPYFHMLEKWLTDVGVLILFIDPKGYVLHIQGEREIQELAKTMNLVEGIEWSRAR
ncbi:hypothetical protein [Aneurinibacillus sp. REN35]|uniref:hypothetical protein n=1 Tax=Aneurinibacillus sp. REN35 TaxID=3237286 RepID=UPI003527B477